ncbi:MAG: hypothetical protein CMF62_04030 [Magnetococcales bacterium]|nr:hypothetical protein [Magnetococcales bacterium]
MLQELINKVYIINLKSCYDRKKHVEQEFKKLKINEYEIIEAIDKDNIQVQNMMKTKFVQKFPPCFRCHKIKCNCINNVLIKNQIGNWCSFINIMNDIIKKDHDNLIMICEDDIKFTESGMDIINKMINKDNLNKYNLDFEKPILIRAGSGFNSNHTLDIEPTLIEKIIMSNPCFICNKLYAKSFIKNLKTINTTSDIYIHRNILLLDETIQSFTLLPQPIYELSSCKFNKFKSEIIPKQFGKYTEKYAKIEYKDFLCIGHPRCGTTSISHYLNQMGYDVGHENMKKDGISSWMLAVNDESYPWGDVNDKLKYYFKNVIHVVRNPFDAIPSIILENKYTPSNKSYNFKKKHIKSILNIDLPNVDFNNISLIRQTEIALKTFIYWNKICELNNPTTICKIENINTLNKFNKNNSSINKVIRNSNKKYSGKVYEKPNITFDIYEKMDNTLKKELKNFCDKYDYNYLLNKNIFRINKIFDMYVPYSKTDGIFISLRTKKTWEPNVTKSLLFKFNEKNIDTFIDIGANIGYYTLFFAHKNIKTYSFEPNLENYNILCNNLKINKFNNSVVHNLGLSDSQSELEFYYKKEKSGHGTFNEKIVRQQQLNLTKKIKVDKLDNINISGKNLMIKIDIEGYELNAIKGMINLLNSNKVKVFCIEISRKFYGKDIEQQIINILKKYYSKLYIVQLKKQLIDIPLITQYDLICS